MQANAAEKVSLIHCYVPSAALEVGTVVTEMVSHMWAHTLRKRETVNK